MDAEKQKEYAKIVDEYAWLMSEARRLLLKMREMENSEPYFVRAKIEKK